MGKIMDIAVGDLMAASKPATGVNLGDERKLAIEARGLVKSFDGTRAVDGVDLSVPEGAIYGVLGPNGAGKTTTLRMLLGIIDPDQGVRRIFGHDRPHDIARLIGYLPEARGLYPAMKAIEAIAFMGALRGLPLAEGRRRGLHILERRIILRLSRLQWECGCCCPLAKCHQSASCPKSQMIMLSEPRFSAFGFSPDGWADC